MADVPVRTLLVVVVLLQLGGLTAGQQIQPGEEDRSADSVVRVSVDGALPRHLCRRALRNLEVSWQK